MENYTQASERDVPFSRSDSDAVAADYHCDLIMPSEHQIKYIGLATFFFKYRKCQTSQSFIFN